MTYEEALTYLEDTSSFGIKPGLERIRALLQALGNPERDYKIIHVTGTNGKGSVTTYISYALFTSGLRVGRFTSPHLESYTERIEINDVQISKDAFGNLIDCVRQGVDKIIANGVEPPTQFEILTAAAFLFFKEQGVDYAVVEAGLGGLLDSTNVVTPVVSVITNVTLDHQAYCGNTVEEIAKHKAGIIKEGVPVVTAAQEGPLKIIEETAEEKYAPLYVFNKKFGIDSRSVVPGGQLITVSAIGAPPAMLFTTMAGIHQSVNLACALQAVRLVMEHDDAISEETMREGFARATWAGRAILSDKDEMGIIHEVVKPKDTVIAVAAPTPRTEVPEKLVETVRQCVKGVVAQTEDSVSSALDLALQSTQDGDIIVVCGSLYILGEARGWLQNRMSH
ncbi:MAG: folylpolyglutamate synthase/dihydrofolate synthase family protein [Veillonella sp.]|nr:folylpolyglutamate synthase/dihydrofolate synthase family protein [Veillonella sp.]